MPTLILIRQSVLLALISLGLLASAARACPFCIAESRTLTEEIADSEVVLFAKLIEPAAVAEALAGQGIPYGFVDPESGEPVSPSSGCYWAKTRWSIPTRSARSILAMLTPRRRSLYGALMPEKSTPKKPTRGKLGWESVDWTIPMPLTETAIGYIAQLFELPPSGGERLGFFLDYLEDKDSMLGQDAYDEFARAPYQDMIDISDQMNRQQLLTWIEQGKVSPSRRRLFLTMLGVCGQPEDVKRIEAMLLSDATMLVPGAEGAIAASLATGGPLGLALVPETIRLAEGQRKLGLDALIACYLTLSGKHGDPVRGLDLIDERFLVHQDANYSHVYAALMALRFLVEEQSDLVPLSRVLKSARLLLDNESFADQVIPDLARWGDWSVLDRLTTLYEASGKGTKNRYVREPIVTYLDVASEQEGPIAAKAKAALARIKPIDPAAMKRARSLRAFGFLAKAKIKKR